MGSKYEGKAAEDINSAIERKMQQRKQKADVPSDASQAAPAPAPSPTPSATPTHPAYVNGYNEMPKMKDIDDESKTHVFRDHDPKLSAPKPKKKAEPETYSAKDTSAAGRVIKIGDDD